MKNKLFAFLGVMFFALLIVVMINMVGCKTATPLKDALGNTLTTQDLQTYGKLVGESGYYVYAYYKNNSKYAKEVKRCEEIYTALEKAKTDGGREGLDLVAINDATCEIITLAATAKLGPTNGALVGAGSRALILMFYQYYKKGLKEDNLEVYLAAVWEGIEAAKKSGADIIAEPTEIDKLVALEPSEECGLVCVIDKVKSRLEAGGLTDYDTKRLKKRLKELQKQYDKEMAEIEAEFEAEGLK